MDKAQISTLIQDEHKRLFEWLDNHDAEKWTQGPTDKWTTGQHVKHLVQSEKAFNKALKMPKFLIKYKFGVSNRDTRSYDQLVAKYQGKLIHAANTNTVIQFSQNMSVPKSSERKDLIRNLEAEKDFLLKKLSKWKESDLDIYIVPHPLLGRMPFREMFMFMGYHTYHHYNILQEKY